VSEFDSSKAEMRAIQRRITDRAAGRLPTTVRTIAHRFVDLGVPDRTKLPTSAGAGALQSAGGDMYFLLDYSALDGPDILM